MEDGGGDDVCVEGWEESGRAYQFKRWFLESGMGVRTGMSLSIVLLCLLYGGIREWRSPTSLSILLFWPDNRSVSEPVRASRSSTRAPTLR